MVSEFGSSMVRVSVEEEEGESLLASFIASVFDVVSTIVLGVGGPAAAVALVVVVVVVLSVMGGA